MDSVVFICFIVFLIYFYSMIRRGVYYGDSRRRRMFMIELLLLAAAVIGTFPSMYRAVSGDIAAERLAPDTALRCLFFLFAVYIIVTGFAALCKKRDNNV